MTLVLILVPSMAWGVTVGVKRWMLLVVLVLVVVVLVADSSASSAADIALTAAAATMKRLVHGVNAMIVRERGDVIVVMN
jgi:hypothetical protein